MSARTNSSGPLRAVRWATQDGAALVRPDGSSANIPTVVPAMNTLMPSNGIGAVWADFTTSPGAGTSSATKITDLSGQSPDPDFPNPVIKLPYTAGHSAVYDYIPASSLSLSTVQSLGVWLRATPRTDGAKYSGVKLLFCASASDFAQFGQYMLMVRADNKWRYYTIAVAAIRSAAGSWTSAVATARIRIREIDADTTTNRSQLSSGDSVFVGTIRTNPRQRAIAMIRFDDNYLSQITPAAIGSTFTGNSGVTITNGSYSYLELVEAFGFKASSFINVDSVGGSGFMTVADLRTLQDAGWDICFQSKANPCSALNAGLRMLGPLGYALIPLSGITNVNTSTGVFTTSATDNLIGGAATGQPFPMEFFGSNLPTGVTAGVKYYGYRISATTFTLHTDPAGSWDGTTGKIIPSTSGIHADFGARYWGSANDSSAILADFQAGTEWMKAQGLSGYRYYALNQGAWDVYTEQALFDFGEFDLMLSISLDSQTSMPVFASAAYSLAGTLVSGAMNFGCLPGNWLNVCSAIGTDQAKTETQIRDYVRNLVRYGQAGSSFHHVQVMSADKGLLWFLDECKIWSDSGMLDVLTASQAWERINEARRQMRLPDWT